LDTGSGQTAFTKKLIVSQNDALTVQSYVVSPGVVQGGIFTFASGTINLQGGADLNLNNTTGNWSGGDLSSTVGGGTVRLYSSAGAPAPTTVLSVYDGGSTLGATLIIGQNSNGTNSPATLNLATSISDMGQMLVLSRSAGIINQPQGVINFNQLRNSATKGGIDMAPGSLSAIRNSGTMWRDIVDAGGDYLTITPPVTDTATGGFFLGTGAAVYFANLYKVNAGAFLVSPGSDAIGVFVGPQGTLSLVSSGQQGAQDQFTFNSDLTVNGGTIQFGYSTGTTEVLNITGNLTINPGSSVVLNVDGRTNGQAADLLNVGGFASINGANLTVNTQEASPASGNTYSFLSAAGGISGSGWAAIFNSGFPANYQIDPANRGQLDVL
jgi:hypothetical protein